MRKVVFSLLLLLCIACNRQMEQTTPEQLGTDVFNAVRNKDEGLLYKHLVNEKDRDNILDSASIYNANLEEVKNMVDYKISSWAGSYSKVLYSLHNEGGHKGIHWDKAKIEKTEYRILEKEGTAKTDIYVHFRSGEISATLRLDDCLKTNRGWIIFDDITLQ